MKSLSGGGLTFHDLVGVANGKDVNAVGDHLLGVVLSAHIAGWLRMESNKCTLTEAGRRAFKRYKSPRDLRNAEQVAYEKEPKGLTVFDPELRDDPKAAADLLWSLYETVAELENASVTIVQSIEAAERERAGCWSVTASEGRVRLNVGKIAALDLRGWEVIVVVATDSVGLGAHIADVELVPWEVKTVSATGAIVEADSIPKAMGYLGPAHLRLIGLCAETSSVGRLRTHSRGVTQLLREYAGLRAPDPLR
jgi:hypothetical protein